MKNQRPHMLIVVVVCCRDEGWIKKSCWLLNIAVPILREIVVGRNQVVNALHKLLGFTGNLECDRWQGLSPHPPLTVALALAFGAQLIAALASLQESLLAVDEATNEVAIASCVGLCNDPANSVDNSANQRIDLVDVGGSADRAYKALDGLNQVRRLIVKEHLLKKLRSDLVRFKLAANLAVNPP